MVARQRFGDLPARWLARPRHRRAGPWGLRRRPARRVLAPRAAMTSPADLPGDIHRSSVGAAFTRAAEAPADPIALRRQADGIRAAMSYADLLRRARAAASRFSKLLAPGDRLA